MATRKKKSTRKTAAQTKASRTAQRQLRAVICFAVAMFLLCIVLVKGQNIWTAMHNFMFGVFGVTAYVYPFILAAVAILFAIDKTNSSISFKIGGSAIVVMLVGACVDVFTTYNEAIPFSEHIKEAYLNGTTLKNGGFFGALLSHPLCEGFGKTGAAITFILLIFVFLMAVTGTTLLALFKLLSKPVKDISTHAESAYQARAERQAEEPRESSEEKRSKLKVIKGFNVDIPIDEIPAKRSRKAKEASLDEKQRRVVSTYYDEEPHETESPEGALDSENMNDALNAAKNEAEQQAPFDAAAEEREMTEKITSGIALTKEEEYRFPPLSLLKAARFEDRAEAARDLDSMAEHLVETLRSFGVETRIVDISRGPSVTRYELQPCAGVKISKITNLADDIALNLATAGVRIEAPIPNKAAVGIEVPNKASAIVGVREIIESPAFTASKSKLTVAMGRDIAGNAVIGDIAKMPHGLIAGATGSGKSVCINSIIMSILYKATPDEVKLLMIDPKVVELGVYNGIPHLLVPVVTDPRKAAGALGWAVSEMEKRYRMFADRGVRDIAGYNRLVETLTDEPEVEKLPQVVIIIDELADLMMTSPKEVEDSINRIAAKARAAGMHLLVATQRPSVDVVTGVIKANIPSRIAFAVSSQIDSRTILDNGGAEKLLGRGDMLFSPIGSNKPSRVQGCFVSDEEVEAVVEFVKNGANSEYDDSIMEEIERNATVDKQKKGGESEGEGDADPMLDEAIHVVVENGQASTSLLQRKLKLGYARAARVIDQLEERGIVGGYEGSKPRKVLITKEQLMEREAGEE